MKKGDGDKRERGQEVKEQKKVVAFDEVFSTGRNTVEVIVKLKKRKNELKPIHSEQLHRRGSWADLLNQHQHHQRSKRNSETQLASASVSQTEKPSKLKTIDSVDLELRKENEHLKNQNRGFVEDLSKAKTELKECFTTIKELRKLSELLKYENECLAQSRRERAALEGSLNKTMSENETLKKHINKLNAQYSQVTIPKDKQISKFRNAIKEMKSTIDEEIGEIRNISNAEDGDGPSLFQQFHITDDEHLLMNDTNPSEIQRLLNSASNSSVSVRDEEGSSTQYMYVDQK